MWHSHCNNSIVEHNILSAEYISVVGHKEMALSKEARNKY